MTDFLVASLGHPEVPFRINRFGSGSGATAGDLMGPGATVRAAGSDPKQVTIKKL